MAKQTAVIFIDHKYIYCDIFSKSSRLAYNKIYTNTINIHSSNILDNVLTNIYSIIKYYKCRKTLLYTNDKNIKLKKIKTINQKQQEDLENIAKVNLSPTQEKINILDGIFLKDLLKNFNQKFPKNFNPCVKNLRDRFSDDTKLQNQISKTAMKLFDTLKHLHNVNDQHKFELNYAIKLSFLNLNFKYISDALKYKITKEQNLLISSLATKENLKNDQTTKWLIFIKDFSVALYETKELKNYDFKLENKTLNISNCPILSQIKINTLTLPTNNLEIKYS